MSALSENKQLLIVGCTAAGANGLDVTPFITGYTVQYPKLWSDDSGRNMLGDNVGTLIGVFTKLVISWGHGRMTAESAKNILSTLNTATQYVKYYDPATMSYRVESFYFGDIETRVSRVSDGNVEISDTSIIANTRRV